MAAVRDKPRAGQIDQTDIVRFIAGHQFMDQMMNGGVLTVIIFVGVALVVEKREGLLRVIAIKRAFLHTDEEARIDLADLGSKKFLNQADTLLAAIQTAATSTRK